MPEFGRSILSLKIIALDFFREDPAIRLAGNQRYM